MKTIFVKYLIFSYSRQELFCAGNNLQKLQETWVGKFLRTFITTIIIEICSDHIFAILNIPKKFQKYFIANKFQSPVFYFCSFYF